MAESKRHKEVKLTPDQFRLNEKGELVINNEEIVGLIRSQPIEAEPAEAGVVSVGVSVGVG